MALPKGDRLDYLAGFFDAEGCVSAHKIKTRHVIRFTVGQHSPEVLQMYQDLFGGSVTMKRLATDKHRESWAWCLNCHRDSEFVSAMHGRLVAKARVMALAVDFLKTVKSTGGRNKANKTPEDIARCMLTPADVEDRERIAKSIREANSGKFDSDGATVPALSAHYLAGLFDGDGNVRVFRMRTSRSYAYSTFVTSAYLPILEAVKAQFAGGVYPNYRGMRAKHWQAGHKTARVFIETIFPFLVIKKSLVARVLELQAVKDSGERIMVRVNKNACRQFSSQTLQVMDSLAESIKAMNRLGPRSA